jgi:hypothetical protein
VSESNDHGYAERPAVPGDPTGDPAGDRSNDRTGNPAVDAVLESLDRLDEAPADEHVAVFEAAHETLRAALADAGNDSRS